MNDTPASKSPEVVTSKGIGSSALLGSVLYIDNATGAHARVETVSDWFVTWTAGGFRFRTKRDEFMSRYSPVPNSIGVPMPAENQKPDNN